MKSHANSGRVILRAFLVCLLLVSLPIKNFAYVAPGAFLFLLFWGRECRLTARVVLLGSFVLSVSFISILIDHLNGQAVNFPGACLAILTYAPLLLLLTARFDHQINEKNYESLISASVWFMLLQSAIGILQFFATGNPDSVCGSFGLLDGFRHSITIAQVYFTFTLFGMISFLLPVANRPKVRVAIIAATLTCVLAQSGHQTIFLVVSLVVCGLLRITSLGTSLRTLGAAAGIGVLVLCFYPDTIWLAQEWFHKVTDPDYSPKYLVVQGASEILAEPKNFLLGAGLGQYTSRAALITSNEYLNLELPGILTGQSAYFFDHVRPAVLLFNSIGEGSAMAKPYMSALSLPVELGIPLTLALLAWLLREGVCCWRMMQSDSEELRWTGFGLLVGICFFMLCCFVENYAEFAQAVFIPFLLYSIAMSRAKAIMNAESLSQTELSPSQFPGNGWSHSPDLGGAR